MFLTILVLAGCGQISAFDNEGMVLGVARSSSQNSSAKEKSQLAAEANALKLLQLCHGGEFLIEVLRNGAISATLQTESEMSGVVSSRLQGADGYSFVMYNMPKADRIPDKYGKNKPEMTTVSGDAENIIHLILDTITQRGSRMLKENGTSHDSIYVEVKKPLFKIKETPPTFRLELLMWIGNQPNQKLN